LVQSVVLVFHNELEQTLVLGNDVPRGAAQVSGHNDAAAVVYYAPDSVVAEAAGAAVVGFGVLDIAAVRNRPFCHQLKRLLLSKRNK
jgi:hypothetical protein